MQVSVVSFNLTTQPRNQHRHSVRLQIPFKKNPDQKMLHQTTLAAKQRYARSQSTDEAVLLSRFLLLLQGSCPASFLHLFASTVISGCRFRGQNWKLQGSDYDNGQLDDPNSRLQQPTLKKRSRIWSIFRVFHGIPLNSWEVPTHLPDASLVM